MSPETTKIVLTVLKVIGIGILLCAVPFLLAGLAGLLENLFCNGDGSCYSNMISVLFGAVLGMIQGLCFAWTQMWADTTRFVLDLTGPKQVWSDPFHLFSIMVPHNVAFFLTYIEAWMKAPLYVIGALMLIKVFTVPLKIMIVPITVAAIFFSYVAYVYTAFLAAAVMFPVLLLLFFAYASFMTLFVKDVIIDDRGHQYFVLK